MKDINKIIIKGTIGFLTNLKKEAKKDLENCESAFIEGMARQSLTLSDILIKNLNEVLEGEESDAEYI